MIPLNELALMCANLDGQLATIADHHAKHVAARTLSEFSNGGSYAAPMAHLARVLRDEFQHAHNVEEQAAKRKAAEEASCPDCDGTGWPIDSYGVVRIGGEKCKRCAGIGALPEPERKAWTPPPPPKPHQWMSSTAGGVSVCANCGVMREGVFAKLNCGSPVQNLTDADREQAREAVNRA